VVYLAGKSIKEINRLGVDNEPTVGQLISAVVLKKGLKGDMQAINFITESIDGRLPQINEVTGKDGGPLELSDAKAALLRGLVQNPSESGENSAN
jgi:DNA polymerase III sliding clamp (beta) subunit (PCNA family)